MLDGSLSTPDPRNMRRIYYTGHFAVKKVKFFSITLDCLLLYTLCDSFDFETWITEL
jgi:hypothetical protein